MQRPAAKSNENCEGKNARPRAREAAKKNLYSILTRFKRELLLLLLLL